MIARALAGADHVEAAGARPVDMFGDERRLIAPGEAVDDARLFGAARKQRPGDDIGLDIDHNDVLAVVDGREAVADADLRVAGRVDGHVERGMRDQRGRVVADMGCAALRRRVEAGSAQAFVAPAGGAGVVARPGDIEIGDAEHMQAHCPPRLGEEHGAEFPGADQPDAHRFARFGARCEQSRKVHGASPSV